MAYVTHTLANVNVPLAGAVKTALRKCVRMTVEGVDIVTQQMESASARNRLRVPIAVITHVHQNAVATGFVTSSSTSAPALENTRVMVVKSVPASTTALDEDSVTLKQGNVHVRQVTQGMIVQRKNAQPPVGMESVTRNCRHASVTRVLQAANAMQSSVPVPENVLQTQTVMKRPSRVYVLNLSMVACVMSSAAPVTAVVTEHVMSSLARVFVMPGGEERIAVDARQTSSGHIPLGMAKWSRLTGDHCLLITRLVQLAVISLL